jgi:pimeloyl-ACP methyl ester carboxylesterase
MPRGYAVMRCASSVVGARAHAAAVIRDTVPLTRDWARHQARSPPPQRSAQRYLLGKYGPSAELQRPSRRWAEKRFLDIRYWNEPERGGHFAAFERPTLFVDEVRAFFRLVR